MIVCVFQAVQDFHSQVVSVVNLVLEQYRDLFADEIMNGNREQTAEGMKQRYSAIAILCIVTCISVTVDQLLKHPIF